MHLALACHCSLPCACTDRPTLSLLQAKLLEFMATFQSERADEQFVEEKEFLINEIANLQPAPNDPVLTPSREASDGDEAGR